MSRRVCVAWAQLDLETNELMFIHVNQDYRRLGYATALLRYIIDVYGRDRALRLTAWSDEGAPHWLFWFYEKHGFRVADPAVCSNNMVRYSSVDSESALKKSVAFR